MTMATTVATTPRSIAANATAGFAAEEIFHAIFFAMEDTNRTESETPAFLKLPRALRGSNLKPEML
jgi:hypothetical protein